MDANPYCKCGKEINNGEEMCMDFRNATMDIAEQMGQAVDDLFLTEEDRKCKDADDWYAQCQDMRVQF